VADILKYFVRRTQGQETSGDGERGAIANADER
jgi:hypothetical protein